MEKNGKYFHNLVKRRVQGASFAQSFIQLTAPDSQLVGPGQIVSIGQTITSSRNFTDQNDALLIASEIQLSATEIKEENEDSELSATEIKKENEEPELCATELVQNREEERIILPENTTYYFEYSVTVNTRNTRIPLDVELGVLVNNQIYLGSELYQTICCQGATTLRNSIILSTGNTEKEIQLINLGRRRICICQASAILIQIG